MKILFCTNAFETVSNGPAKFARGLLKLHDAFPQHEVRILTEDCSAQVAGAVYRLPLNIPRPLTLAGMFIRMRTYHKVAMEIREKEFPFDVLVYNNAVVGAYSMRRFENTFGFVNDDNNLLPPLAGRSRKEFLRRFIFFKIEQSCAKHMRGIIVNSKYLYSQVHSKYQIPEEKIHLVYKSPGITPVNVQKNNEIPHILFVKNDYLRGGLFILIQSLIRLNRKVKLTIIGLPGAAKDRIAQACADTLIAWEFIGIVSQEMVYAYMQKADIFCVPSLREALGVANMEAMCFDCNIVTTEVGGIPEVLDNGHCGRMALPNDPESLAQALKDCLDQPDQNTVKRQNAKEFVRSFNAERTWKEFLEALQYHAART